MAVDVVTLSIRVDASQVEAATRAITGLGGTAVVMEARTNAATVSTGRLNNALLGLARQATGTSPVLARFTDVLLGMAYGGAQMTAILAGLAAVGLAFRKLTEDSRNARQEAERLRGVLDGLATLPAGYGLGQAAGQASADVARLTSERDYARAQAAIYGGDSSVLGRRANTRAAVLEAELSEARGRLIAGNRAIVLSQRDRAEDVADRYGDGYQFTGPTLEQRGGLPSFTNWAAVWGEGRRDVDPRFSTPTNNIAAMAGASWARMLPPSAGGNAWAIGSGGFGGALDSIGPSIVSSVSSIVQGLADQAEKAALAQRAWSIALEDYQLMFDETTPTESRIRQNEQAFRQRAEQLRGTYGHGLIMPTVGETEWYLENMASATDPYDKALRTLYDAYLANADQARNLAEAERDLYDARFRALNAPSGFNLAYYGWGAGSGGGDSPQTKADKGVDVYVYVDGEEVATRVERHAKTSARRGGPSPYTTTAR